MSGTVISFSTSGERVCITSGWSTDLEPYEPKRWVYYLIAYEGDEADCGDHVSTHDTYEEARAEALDWNRERGSRIEEQLGNPDGDAR